MIIIGIEMVRCLIDASYPQINIKEVDEGALSRIDILRAGHAPWTLKRYIIVGIIAIVF